MSRNRQLLATVSVVIPLVVGTMTASAATINYEGEDYFINGVNVPWNSFGNDVGGDGYDAAWFENFFAQCEQNGINCVRLWIHCSGWATPEFDGNGYVTGLDANFLSDFDDLMQRAQNHNVMVMPCLWSFDMTRNQNGIGLISDVNKTQSYIDNALIPIVQHMANTPNLFAWEISNEPEWSVVDQDVVSKENLQRFCAMLAAAIHQNCDKMVTVGTSCLKWNSDISPAEGNWWSDAALQAQYNSPDAYLDFYQVHYYDWMNQWGYSPFDLNRPLSYWELDKPVLIGENPGDNNGIYTIKQQVDNAYANGYVGVMFWSYNSDYSGNWNDMKQELKTFRDAHPDIIDYNPGPPLEQEPYSGTPLAIPGRIESEDYDKGGEGLAYHDSESSNQGAAYRSDGVDIEACTDTGSGYNVGWIVTDEWLEYTVNVTSSEEYDILLRVAAQGSGGTLHVESDDTDKTGTVTVPDTTGWQTWQTVRITGVTLTRGEQIMRAVIDSGSFNINWIDIVKSDADSDGMPDYWEVLYFRSSDVSAGGRTEDWDEDGLCDLDEYLAGTSPTDPNSVLALTSAEKAAVAGLVLRWQSSAGKYYTIEQADDLLTGFAPGTTGIAATPPINVHTVALNQASARFYRVVVE